MAKLKGVIFGLRDVIVSNGTVDGALLKETGKLVAFLKKKGIVPVALANDDWEHTDDAGKKEPADAWLGRLWGAFPFYIHARGTAPKKPTTAAVQHVLTTHGWQPNEVVYIGNSKMDMASAVNANVLFVNATWYGAKTDYGFHFDTPLEVARFIDTFCLRDHLWGFQLATPEFYALSTFATGQRSDPIFHGYSANARDAAKLDTPYKDFWLKYLVSTVYFSGLHEKINIVAAVPGHQPAFGHDRVSEVLDTFAKCFKSVRFIPDLIERHRASIKSQTARTSGVHIDHCNQLNTIRLTQLPMKSATGRYVHSPLTPGKTVLVVDDICTNGYTLEAARAFIEKTGAKAIGLAWLKTISSDYMELAALPRFNPYVEQRFDAAVAKTRTNHWYSKNVVDPAAAAEIDAKLRGYPGWKWP